MDWFELPGDLEEAKILRPWLILAILFALPVLLYRNLRFKGLAPRGADEWREFRERMLSVVAVTYSACPSSLWGGPSPIRLVGLTIALLLIVFSVSGVGRACGWIAVWLQMIGLLIFPELSSSVL